MFFFRFYHLALFVNPFIIVMFVKFYDKDKVNTYDSDR